MIADLLSTLAARPWVAVAIAFVAFLLLIGGLVLYARLKSPDPELVRKSFHVGSGLLTLTFPFLFVRMWPVLLLTGMSALLVAAIQFVPSVRRRLESVLGGSRRMTLGELTFPISVAIVFWLARGRSPLIFCIPILVLTLADATGAIVGTRYGQHRFTGASKSAEGSIAFTIVAFFCINVPLVLWSSVGRVETLLISITLALIVMLLEGSAWQGLDNLFIPIGGCVMLRIWMTLDTDALLARFIVTAALVVIILLFRHRTTLEDDALLAAAFFCYVTWALLGWRWLVPPAVAFVGYAWMSPPTPENSQRIHDVPAVLAVWLVAIVWAAIAHAIHDTRLLYPFTLVFAAHVAIFGASRLAGDFPTRALPGLAAEAIAKGWLMILAPYVALEGVSRASVSLAAAALAATALAVVMFIQIQPSIRDTPIDRPRWIRQALCAAASSAAGWAAMQMV